tara:strand:- start:71 stop:1012 length:942 start_codon:yes stop_codon:yes gene_type:complete
MDTDFQYTYTTPEIIKNVEENVTKSLQEMTIETPKDYKTVVGVLVAILTAMQVYSYFMGESKKNPQLHTGSLILGYAIVIPYILRLSPSWYSYPIQLFITLLIVVLDWFSFHEDKSRFSEAELCIVGNCRWNSRVTGHLAHIVDTAAVGLMIVPLLEDNKSKYAVVAGLLVYMAVGSKAIEDMTKDGSISDLRGKSEEEKCKQARIMRDSWRGGLNDLITVLGIMLAWQSFFSCESGKCDSKSFPLNQVTNMFEDLSKEQASKKLFWLTLARIVVIDLGMAIIPTYVNYINTSYQHGRMPASLFDLPSCFDDN